MMLAVLPVKHEDATQCVALRLASLGSLVIGRLPAYPGYIQDQEASLHKDLDSSLHVHHLKVVDAQSQGGEIVAYAKWEVYADGRPDLAQLRQPMKQSEMEVDRFGRLRRAAYWYFSRCNGETGKRPHILLALLATASQHRRRGAGGLLVRWGIDLSETTRLPCYLQASEQGRRLYGHYGFREIDTVEFNLSEYGLGEGVERMTEMVRIPAAVDGLHSPIQRI
ncbi:uncharacterized protein A1O5_13097 [Cladophialophora psammophila CBS 110553]|uniref:N-acetyltransferase domain-containing protein n=1 Tax=Cladophialophora psammophila CBS 110553 TaxID=1182543 RepID=W9VND8_9EURO|nr:uncharacterized protein A1O5_13097 [Cladophialophora psammophila CBS 110553]EXJ53646.1 hypothetical protein A1O5_13097 [Cladophialophora psammophila CBS 110553]